MAKKSTSSAIQTASVIAILIVALSVAYYLVIFIPNKANRELQSKQAERQIYKNCENEATTKARELLKSKINVANSTGQAYSDTVQIWKAAADKGLFLKDDYTLLYDNCLKSNGIKY